MANEKQKHKAGFVSIVGRPNVGKSTLMNALVGERLSIITSKAQTTRHRILGIISSDDFQLVYSDTPGIIKPNYVLHQAMMKYVDSALEDADVILFMTDLYETLADSEAAIEKLNRTNIPVILLLNKIDQAKGTQAHDKLLYWKEHVRHTKAIAISALQQTNTDDVFASILELMPEHPPFFDKDAITDRPERFFAAEIIREKIFLNYKKEVPYSCQVVVEEFKEEETIIRMRALIFVERQSQKGIIIGHQGQSLKKVGIEARKDLEAFFAKQVHLETHVKVEKDWRKQNLKVNRFGYDR